jgi:alpha-tubulin suppressor-like RCC1 family protein
MAALLGMHALLALPAAPASAVAIMKDVTSGYDFACAISAPGDAYCWGENTFGQLGDGTNTSTSEPVAVANGLKFASLEGGYTSVCGITLSGDAYC